MTCSDASPARSYRGAPGAQGPCFDAAAAAASTTRLAAAVPSISTRAAASTISAAAMREIVHLQAGQCGNQIGAKVREGPGLGRQSRDAERGPPSSAELLHHGPFGERGPPGGQHPRDGGEGRRGQGQAGNKEAHGGGAQASVRLPQLASQLAHCPLRTHKETPPLPTAAARER